MWQFAAGVFAGLSLSAAGLGCLAWRYGRQRQEQVARAQQMAWQRSKAIESLYRAATESAEGLVVQVRADNDLEAWEKLTERDEHD